MGGKVDTSKDQWWQKHNASNMVEVHSMDEFLGELKRCGEGKLVIVDFYARWCAACRALHPKLCKIAEANSADVVVIKIEFDDNKDLCRGMGVVPDIGLGKFGQMRVRLAEEFHEKSRDAVACEERSNEQPV